MGLIIYLDGEYVPEQEAKISVFDHGLLYGDGVFEGIRAYHGSVFRLDEHLTRLYESARSIALDIGVDQKQMKEIVLETLRRNKLKDAYIRLVVTRGKGDLGLDPRKCEKPFVFCIATDIQLYPEELYEKGLKVITVPTRRNIPDALSPRVKSLNYLNNILAKIEGIQSGVSEAIMLNREGFVAEGTGDNIFIVKNKEIITPPHYAGILEGITRNSVMELAREKGYRVKEELFTRHEIFVADECFLTGTAAEIIPVVSLDERTIGEGVPGEVTNDLIQSFRNLTKVEGTPIYPKENETAILG